VTGKGAVKINEKIGSRERATPCLALGEEVDVCVFLRKKRTKGKGLFNR